VNTALKDVETLIDHVWIHSETDMDVPVSGRFLHGHTACFTHSSPDKDRNQDALALVPTGHHTGVVAVADGLGGQPKGEAAARTAVEAVAAAAGAGYPTLREAILHGIDQANREIIEAGYGGGATLAVLEIEERHVRPYHIGDAFVLITGQRGRVKFQNIAHSPVGYAVESGLIDEHDAVHHHERNLVSNFVGSSDMYIDVGPRIELAPRDTIVVASDGLSDNLYVEEIVDSARVGDIADAADTLRTAAMGRMTGDSTDLPSHPDDLTFCLFRLDAALGRGQLRMEF